MGLATAKNDLHDNFLYLGVLRICKIFFVAKIKISDKYFVFVTPSHRSHYHKHVYPIVQKQFIY
jgi:hypothetical protein